MNKTAALIALGIGGTFLALEAAYPYRAMFGFSVGPLANVNQSKARAAVSSLLFDPDSAEFDGLRSVEAERTQYVCGDVKAKDRGGSFSGPRAFVYEVKLDIARIDDTEQIARIHAAYRPCPEDIDPSRPMPLDLEKARKLLKYVPKVDAETLRSLDSPLTKKQFNSGSGAKDLRTGLNQFRDNKTLGQIAGADAAATEADAGPAQAGGSFTADLKNEPEWRGDRPPAAWPKFPPDDPLSGPVRKRTPEQAIALGSDVEARWKSFKAGRSPARPRASTIEEALGALLTIDPNSPHFPKAWALFVGLRQIDREATAMESSRQPPARSARPRG